VGVILDSLALALDEIQVGHAMSSLHPPSVNPIPRLKRVAAVMCSVPKRHGVLVALCAVILGLAVLCAASLGKAELRIPGFALLAVSGVTAAIFLRRKERQEHDREAVAHLQTARERLEQGDPGGSMMAASKAASSATTPSTRNAALTTLAWGALGQGYLERAKAALNGIEPGHALDVYCFAAVESACGKPGLAIEALEIARTAGTLTCDGAKLLVDCYVQQCGIDRAVIAALQNREVLGAENCKTVMKAARDVGAHAAAATLASALRSDMRPLRIVQGHGT
jgi:hypothetical protein